jgi:hypothetical protein
MVKSGYSKISPIKFALSTAIIMAVIVILTTLATIWEILSGFPILISIIGDLYGRLGYTITYLGALIGAVYVFIDTFIISIIFAWLYNKLIN